MERYSTISAKNEREILLLRGSGCKWRACTFCDYHLDYDPDPAKNFALNAPLIVQVTGQYHKLEVINSGSFVDLDEQTLSLIYDTCVEKGIKDLWFECHYMHRKEIPAVRAALSERGIRLHIKTGVETFDVSYREEVLHKGFGYATPDKIASYANECCLLFGLTGQTVPSMENDIATGLRYFDRICINIMTPNTSSVKPDKAVISDFVTHIAPKVVGNPRVDLLMENTDFGVGQD